MSVGLVPVSEWRNDQSSVLTDIYVVTIQGSPRDIVRRLETEPPSREIHAVSDTNSAHRAIVTATTNLTTFSKRVAFRGRKLRHNFQFEDAMIAATARVHQLIVATRKEADFKQLNVRLVNPFKS